MSDEPKRRGVLVAIDGSRGLDVREGAIEAMRYLKASGRPGGISGWDASGLFTDVKVAKRRNRQLSPRTLVLLYAADLAFRLRWAIRPALDAGQVVIAAPYTSTVMAMGIAAGLPRGWLEELFRFAPPPTASFCVKEHKRASGWSGKALGGFPEFCGVTLHGELESPEAIGLRQRMLHHLDVADRRLESARVSRKRMGALLA